MWERIRLALIWLGCAVLLGIVGVYLVGILQTAQPLQPAKSDLRERVYTIPPGAMERVRAGENLSLLPNIIPLTLGKQDTLVIRNEDTEVIEVAGIQIAPGQQYRQQFLRAGKFSLVCTVHPLEELYVIVQEPK